MSYKDSGHRPHADFKGEVPKTDINVGPSGIRVTLDSWGPNDGKSFACIYNQLQSNWGGQNNLPSRVVEDRDLSEFQWLFISNALKGGFLQNALEIFTFSFTVEGVTRACTHQLVRTRVGASMMQHGGRDNDWRHQNWTLPETIRRVIRDIDDGPRVGERMKITSEIDVGISFVPKEYQYRSANISCLRDEEPLLNYLHENAYDYLGEAVQQVITDAKMLYAALVDAGIPWQDARRVLPIGLQTYIHLNYNYVALKGVLANRLEHVMDWEINCVAQLMLRELRIKCPMLAEPLGSHSDIAGKAKFGELESWPPDQKYPYEYDPSTRTHTPEQNPFWVLTEDAMNGGPIQWIPTNGVHPDANGSGQVKRKAL